MDAATKKVQDSLAAMQSISDEELRAQGLRRENTDWGIPVFVDVKTGQVVNSDNVLMKKDLRAKGLTNNLSPEQQQALFELQKEKAQMEKDLAEAKLKNVTGPELYAKPIQRFVTDRLGNRRPVDDKYKLRPGETEEFDLRREFKLEGPEKFLEAQQAKIAGEETQGREAANLQAAQGLANLRATMARGGIRQGSTGGLQRQSLRDIMLAQQGASGKAAQARLDLGVTGENMRRETNQMNLKNLLAGVEGVNTFEMEKYKQQKAVEAAQKQADATRAAASSGGGCCFIFLEARYGNGTMDEVVRMYRDSNVTPERLRGYYKLSEVLVPLMRKYPLIKGLVRLTLTDPLVAYGKAYYGKGSKLGFIFKPLKDFWMKTFEYLGGKHEFIRENGEVI